MPRVTVGPRTGGGWQVDDGERRFDTEAEAEQFARLDLERLGGGELVIKRRDGRIREQNTIGRADPRGSKG